MLWKKINLLEIQDTAKIFFVRKFDEVLYDSSLLHHNNFGLTTTPPLQIFSGFAENRIISSHSLNQAIKIMK